ncbi:hypothetical protein [Blautia faecis]|jgi:hypothetical protein|uniref:hypothetical protein n=1 Tax=Clostridia TaxID=186801 RepID=UPI00156D4434|nr:hypothetical protein [Blautia faecis]NSG94117.1 hypothetical protein [Blautia faecis]
MEEELIYKEYDMLHQEIEQKISLQNNLLIFMITTTVTIITLAIKSDSLLLYLFPFFIIIPITSRIAYYRMAMAKISAYMIVFLEPKLNGISWETRNVQFLRRYNSGKRNDRKIQLDYYECPVLGVICYLLYLLNYEQLNINNLKDGIMIFGPALLVFMVIHMTYKINSLDRSREKMIDAWRKIESEEKLRKM